MKQHSQIALWRQESPPQRRVSRSLHTIARVDKFIRHTALSRTRPRRECDARALAPCTAGLCGALLDEYVRSSTQQLRPKALPETAIAQHSRAHRLWRTWNCQRSENGAFLTPRLMACSSFQFDTHLITISRALFGLYFFGLCVFSCNTLFASSVPLAHVGTTCNAATRSRSRRQSTQFILFM